MKAAIQVTGHKSEEYYERIVLHLYELFKNLGSVSV